MSNSPPVVVSPATAPYAELVQRARWLLVRRRVKLSQALFAGLVIKDVALGLRPHGPFNLADPASLAGWGLIAAGLALRSWAAGTLCKDSTVSRAGPYSLVRHPLYLGSFLLMFGFCAFVGDWMNWVVVAGPVALIYLCRVLDEEAWLERRHPTLWAEYARRTPRFVPRTFRAGGGPWRFTQWLQSQEFHAPIGVALGLAAIWLWSAV